MKISLRSFVYFIIGLSVYLFIPLTEISASGEFLADYEVQYAIAPSGKTIVTQHVTLTNQLPNYYPQEYSLLLDSDKISNVIAYDDGGIITPSFYVRDGKTEITLTFNVKTIGLGKSFKFSLRYEHSGVASKNGSIWEIYVPGVVNDPDIGKYDVTLSVPPTFGPAAYLSPKPAQRNSWTKDQMIRGGIAAAYGPAQRFDLTLTYTLENGNLTSQIQEIALPPSTAFQKIGIRSLDPQPLTVVSDADGNWLARYEIAPRQRITVTAKATASIFLAPRREFEGSVIREAEYLGEERYWEIKNDAISRLASTLKTPKQIYDYVSSTLTYNYEKVNGVPTRLGAAASLKSPKDAVCMEFTDLFIAIARAAGIPARRVVGYAFTNNPKLRPLSLVSDVLHAWPEYYDRELNVWIPVDPTWANTTGGVDYFTKLDFNHIVFAMNGLDSTAPYPAGYYRREGKTGRDVVVEFALSAQDSPANVTATIEFPERVGAGTRAGGAIVVRNSGGDSAYNISLSALSKEAGILVTDMIPELLPHAVVRVPITGVFDQTITGRSGQIQARVNDVTITQDFRIEPLYWLMVLGSITFLLSLIVGLLLIKRFLWNHLKKH